MASQNDKGSSSKNSVNSSSDNSYKADRKTEKENEQESLKNAIKEGGKVALDAHTGGAISKVEKVPIVGKRLNKKLDKAAGKIAKLDKLTGGRIGQAAKKLDDAGAIDALKKVRGMNNNGPKSDGDNSNGSNSNKKEGDSSKKSPGIGFPSEKDKKNKSSTNSLDDNLSDDKSEKDFDLISKITGSGFFNNPKVKLALLGGGIILFFMIGAMAVIFGSDTASEGMESGKNAQACASNTAILEIAEREVGNNEANGTHAKYLSYLGFSPSTAWCAAFVSWCANEAGIDETVIPRTAAVSSFLDYFKKAGTFRELASGYTPSPGDLIIWKAKGRSHIGIVKEYNQEANTLITVEGNSSNAVRVNTYQYSNLEAQGVVGFANPTQECSSSDNPESITAGKEIVLPINLGTHATREFDLAVTAQEIAYSRNVMKTTRKITNPYAFPESTPQRRVQDKWIAEGAKHDNQGFCKLQGRYIIAATKTFGYPGDKVDFYMSNGKIINVILGDTKNFSDKGCSKWGHSNGKNVLEFMGRNSIGDNPYLTLGLNGNSVVKAINGGSIL